MAVQASAMDPRRAGRAVVGFSLRNTLVALQQIATEKQYIDLLTSAGLGRYARTLPEPTFDIAASEEEFSRLFAQIYATLGENVMRTMMRNWGVALGPIIGGSEMVVAAEHELTQKKPADLFRWAVEKAAQVTDAFWAPVDLHEDEHYFLLEVVRCPICTQIHGAHEPICTNALAIYSVIMQRLTGKKAAVRELHCAATGDPACVYAITKPVVLPGR